MKPVKLVVREHGSGPPLIILHGLFGSSRNWHHLIPRLAAHHHVFALDLRNHGDSPWAEPMDYPAMAADVRLFMEEKGLTRAALLGHSMGGKVAMTLALLWPDRVSSLVVVDIAPVAYPDVFAPYIEGMQNLNLDKMKSRSGADVPLSVSIRSPEVRAFLLQNLVLRDGGFQWRCNLSGVAAHLPHLLGFPADLLTRRFMGPSLFVRGAQSDYVRQEHRSLIANSFPKASFEVIAGAGHWVHVDQPVSLTHQLLAFLARRTARTRLCCPQYGL